MSTRTEVPQGKEIMWRLMDFYFLFSFYIYISFSICSLICWDFSLISFQINLQIFIFFSISIVHSSWLLPPFQTSTSACLIQIHVTMVISVSIRSAPLSAFNWAKMKSEWMTRESKKKAVATFFTHSSFTEPYISYGEALNPSMYATNPRGQR